MLTAKWLVRFNNQSYKCYCEAHSALGLARYEPPTYYEFEIEGFSNDDKDYDPLISKVNGKRVYIVCPNCYFTLINPQKDSYIIKQLEQLHARTNT